MRQRKNLVLDEVFEIAEAGEFDTYECTILDTHCYFANGILLHNSADLAGDPDSVILLHRERRAVVEKTVSSGLGTYMPETLVRVDKARYNSGGDIYLRAIDESGIFEEI